jgi:hypothetical protein
LLWCNVLSKSSFTVCYKLKTIGTGMIRHGCKWVVINLFDDIPGWLHNGKCYMQIQPGTLYMDTKYPPASITFIIVR